MVGFDFQGKRLMTILHSKHNKNASKMYIMNLLLASLLQTEVFSVYRYVSVSLFLLFCNCMVK